MNIQRIADSDVFIKFSTGWKYSEYLITCCLPQSYVILQNRLGNTDSSFRKSQKKNRMKLKISDGKFCGIIIQLIMKFIETFDIHKCEG